MSEEPEEMIQRLRVEACDPAKDYVLLLERALMERLRVNVGLVRENADLRRGRDVPGQTEEFSDAAIDAFLEVTEADTLRVIDSLRPEDQETYREGCRSRVRKALEAARAT